MRTTRGNAWLARMRSLSANPSHQVATSAFVVLGPGVGAWATTTSQAKSEQETVATSTRGSSAQARTPPGSMATGGLPGPATERVWGGPKLASCRGPRGGRAAQHRVALALER
eukprot:8103881-Alexandrium_andersonii.AAC.1